MLIRYLFFFMLFSVASPTSLLCQISLGSIQDNTNDALPSSYDFQEYVFAEPDDQGICLGNINNSATVEDIFLSQTHRHSIQHPLFFTIGQRPALFQVAITGTGLSPDVVIEGILNGTSIGTLCLNGPAELSTNLDLEIPNMEDYFSVTLPKNWVQHDLELRLNVGSETITISSEDLKIGPYTEMNLVMVNMDVMDYNGAPHQWPVFNDFLQEMASAIPASTVRFGVFPETMKFPEVIANNDTEQLVRLTSRSAKEENGIFSDGSINSIATLFLGNLHRSTGDYLSTVYFGNTLNLSPGGWGGGKSFVGFDYTDIFIHELGHALSLPHWGQGSYDNQDLNEYNFLYPYGGEDDDGGGRGQAWNFIQDKYEFVSTICQYDDFGNEGKERSDCMQRNNACLGERSYGPSPWDGYGDFSALAIHRYLTGANTESGQVSDRGEMKDYQFNMQRGFPIVSLENDKREYARDPLQAQELTFEENFDLPGEEQINQEVYLIYGSAHESQEQANIVYKPIKYNGTLPPVIDPTNSETFEELKGLDYLDYLYGTRDITIKVTYEDGSILHAINPYHSYQRAPYTWGYHIWRDDVCNFSLVVPGDKNISKVELYKRPFCIRYPDNDTEGNINYEEHNITSANFMDDAMFQAEYVFGSPSVLGSNTIGNRVWHDLNQNGIEDSNEEGIAGVSLVLWRDGDGDDIPDWMGFSGVTVTDDQGYYSFSGLGPGNYLVFVWSVDNWEEGQPLHGMTPTEIYVEDPNTDINFDNNGRFGEEWGLTNRDIVSGMITLTEDGEPLDDGDREDDWFNYDPSGNMTIDFGFHQFGVSNVTNENNKQISVYPNPATDIITISRAENLEEQLIIIDSKGQEVYQEKMHLTKTDVNVNNLAPGMYLLNVKNGQGKLLWSKKVIKIK